MNRVAAIAALFLGSVHLVEAATPAPVLLRWLDSEPARLVAAGQGRIGAAADA